MLCFLLGRKMYEGAGLGEADLEHAMTVMGLGDPGEGSVEPGPEWVVGLLEHYPETVSLFAAACPEHFPEPEAVHKKRVTLHKPPLEEAAAGFPGGEKALRAAFREANALDCALYEAAARRFAERRAERERAGGQATAVEVLGDRYDYLLKYRKKQSIARPFAPDDGRGLEPIAEIGALANTWPMSGFVLRACLTDGRRLRQWTLATRRQRQRLRAAAAGGPGGRARSPSRRPGRTTLRATFSRSATRMRSRPWTRRTRYKRWSESWRGFARRRAGASPAS